MAPGPDFIRIAGDCILSVEGYFDSRAAPEQLGLHVLVHGTAAQHRRLCLRNEHLISVGYNNQTRRFSITKHEARSDEEVNQIKALGRQIATTMMPMERS
jgi:hypothetical protein